MQQWVWGDDSGRRILSELVVDLVKKLPTDQQLKSAVNSDNHHICSNIIDLIDLNDSIYNWSLYISSTTTLSWKDLQLRSKTNIVIGNDL